MLKLCGDLGACAMAAHIGLGEAGADYEIWQTDLRACQQPTPEYLAINPAGVTPALQTSEGVITQNAAILAYAAQTHPQAGLADLKDPFTFARMQAVNGWLASSLHPAIGKALFSKPPLEGEAKEEAVKIALEKYDLAENHVLTGTWVMGEDYSMADGYLMVFTRWARQAGLLDKTRFPKLNDHLDRVQARPAVQRVLEAEGIPAV